MNKLLNAEFIEGRVLPVVLAFGLGVIASAVAHDTERAAIHGEQRIAKRALMACIDFQSGAAAAHIATAHEAQP